MSDTAPSLRVEPLGSGRFSVLRGETRQIAYAIVAGGQTWVWLNGSAYLVSSSDPEERQVRTRVDEMAMAAPMPATVRAIAASVGQAVSAGDTLVVLEAMKMEMAIKAPRDGRVRALHCTLGELVRPGIPLVELE